jgi:Ras-related protein Rab-2A
MSKIIPRTVYDYILKFIIVGDTSVGKSNILSRFANNRFRKSHDMTIGVDFATKLISRNNVVYKLQFWDTAGQEAFRSITKTFYRGAIGCLIVYDVTNRKSFESLSFWIGDLKQYCDQNTVIILVGNKVDLESEREISTDEGKALAESNNLLFFETSAATGFNIRACFDEAIDKISEKITNGKLNMIKSNNNIQGANITLNKPNNSNGSTTNGNSGCAC